MALPSHWLMRRACRRTLWTCVLLIVMNVSSAKRVITHEILREVQDTREDKPFGWFKSENKSEHENKQLGFYVAEEVVQAAQSDKLLVTLQADIKKMLRLRKVLRAEFDSTFSDTYSENKTRSTLSIKGTVAALSTICLGDVVFDVVAGAVESLSMGGEYAGAADTFVGNAVSSGDSARTLANKRKKQIQERRLQFVNEGAEMRTQYFPDVALGRLYQAYEKTFRAMKNLAVYKPQICNPVHVYERADPQDDSPLGWCGNTLEIEHNVKKSAEPLAPGTEVTLLSEGATHGITGEFKTFAADPFTGLTDDELKKCIRIKWKEDGEEKEGYVPLVAIKLRDWRQFSKTSFFAMSKLPIFEDPTPGKMPLEKGVLKHKDFFIVTEQKEYGTVSKETKWVTTPGYILSETLHEEEMTIPQAKSKCSQIEGCKGFYHPGGLISDSDSRVISITFGGGISIVPSGKVCHLCTSYVPKDSFFALRLADGRGWIRVGLPFLDKCGVDHCAPHKAVNPLRASHTELDRQIEEFKKVEQKEAALSSSDAVGTKWSAKELKIKAIHGSSWCFAGRLLIKGGLFAAGFFTGGITWAIGAAIGLANATASAHMHLKESEILDGNTAFLMGILAAFEIEHLYGKSVKEGRRTACDIVKAPCPGNQFCLTRGVFVHDGDQGRLGNRRSTSGVCVLVPRPLLEIGATCATEFDCKSGYCDMHPYVLPQSKQDKADKKLSSGWFFTSLGSSKTRKEALVTALTGVCRQPCLREEANCHIEDEVNDAYGVLKD